MDEQIEIEIGTDENLCECESCGESVAADSTIEVRTGYRRTTTCCETCADDTIICESCEERASEEFSTRIRVSSRRTVLWCDSCISEGDTVTNSDSGELATSDYAVEAWYFHESDEEWHDDPEESDDDDSESELHDYNCNVIEEHGWPRVTPRASLCFGVELEMESTVRRGELIEALDGRDGNGSYILKSDGSLDGARGVELVTLPYTLDYHAGEFDWPSLLKVASRRARSGSGTTACGMHVHVNRKALTPLQIGKALVFLNCESNARFVTCVAQRSSNGYASRDTSKTIKDAKYRAFSRYDMLNISNGQTVEFRLFRGNLRAERVLKNLEFCHALLTYCATVSMQHVEHASLFCDWLNKRSRTYPHLTRFLRDNGYLAARRPIPTAYATATAAVVDA